VTSIEKFGDVYRSKSPSLYYNSSANIPDNWPYASYTIKEIGMIRVDKGNKVAPWYAFVLEF